MTSTAATRRGQAVPLACALALTMLHFFWITAHVAPATMSPDANGYIVQGRLIATEGRTSFSPASPAQYVGMHWLETSDGVFHSRYPAGLPVLFAAAWKVGGLSAAVLINPLLASATVFLVFWLSRRFVGAHFALVAAAVVATVPVFNQHALDADAHVAATFFLVAGVLALLRFGDTRSPAVGLHAGVLLGAVPSMRYPEAVVGFAVALWLLWKVRPWTRAWPAVLGAALPIGALGLHNTSAYGAFWRTGYSLTNEQTGFGLGYFADHVLPYLQALGGSGLSLFFAFGAAGLAALAVAARRRSEGLLFVGIVTPLVLLYMAYYFGGGMGGGAANLRFLIPSFPFFAIAGAWLLSAIAFQFGTAGRVAALVVVLLQLTISIGGSMQTLARAKSSLGSAARIRTLAEKEVPDGSVLIMDRQLAESLDATGRWKLLEESMLVGGGPGAGPGATRFGPAAGRGGMFRPPVPEDSPEHQAAADAPSPMQRGKNRAQQERYAVLDPESRRTRVWEDAIQWAGDRPIFWFARSTDVVEDVLPPGADYVSIGEADAPTMFGPGGGGGPMAQPPGALGRGGRGGPGRGGAPGGFGPPGGAGGVGRGGGRMLAPGAMGGRGGMAATPNQKLRLVRITTAPQR